LSDGDVPDSAAHCGDHLPAIDGLLRLRWAFIPRGPVRTVSVSQLPARDYGAVEAALADTQVSVR
jgi:hypothetical protein